MWATYKPGQQRREGTQKRSLGEEASVPGSPESRLSPPPLTKAQRWRQLPQGHTGGWGQRGVEDPKVLAPRDSEGFWNSLELLEVLSRIFQSGIAERALGSETRLCGEGLPWQSSG